jgi:ribosome modulation factor
MIELSEAYDRGYSAFQSDDHTNPYEAGTVEWNDWVDGWQAAYLDKHDDGGPDIHNEGVQAFEDGKNWNSCPYDENTPEARLWMGGWWGAYERRENQ